MINKWKEMMKGLKFIVSNPFIFAEKRSVDKFEELAEEGWQIKKIWLGGFMYILEEVEPKSISYYFDSQPNPTEQYYRVFYNAGWKLVDTSNSLHLFFAPAGTTLLERNSEKLQTRFRSESSYFGKYSIGIFIAILFVFLGWVFIEWNIVRNLLIGVLSILIIGFSVTFTPYAIYKWRIQKLRNNDRN
ncbi:MULTISPECIES: DUF2812 domain-containing protein [Oceanobacillus]|uniref:DUF2812 domain-containing protein n=1 Tax=Oceanobacillus kimchii TaxID=746691 RepID=A0ABQ5TN06_9BACI|nr:MULTISPECIES: DUF2812 domain-containing protein [Oceanobacillus]GLO68193.1 hypothetical protein MACH08_39770 [Oceanobacillus kimchii]